MTCLSLDSFRSHALLGPLPVATPFRGGCTACLRTPGDFFLALGPETEVCGPEPFPHTGGHAAVLTGTVGPHCGDAKACCAGVGWDRPSGGVEVWLCLPWLAKRKPTTRPPWPSHYEPTGLGACLFRVVTRVGTGTRARKTACRDTGSISDASRSLGMFALW